MILDTAKGRSSGLPFDILISTTDRRVLGDHSALQILYALHSLPDPSTTGPAPKEEAISSEDTSSCPTQGQSSTGHSATMPTLLPQSKESEPNSGRWQWGAHLRRRQAGEPEQGGLPGSASLERKPLLHSAARSAS
ncbi:hypothetical protein WJX73_007030 [Symbiochloris irregularis]|uniref:Uncharacterized protein n=1 Tax=Symbiochloris irregularis TaxID=706552 RepID=A0AAW1PUX0_9CHLO